VTLYPKEGEGVSAPSLTVPQEVIIENIRDNANQPTVAALKEKDTRVAIVGGAPSLKENLDKLRKFKGHIFACNGAYDYLLENGVKPRALVVIDARPLNKRFTNNAKIIYLANSCDPSLFDKRIVMFEPLCSTVGLSTLFLCYTLGYRDFTLYGMDGCYSDGHHAYPQAENDNMKTITLPFGDKEYVCDRWMAEQAHMFIKISDHPMFNKLSIVGDGLLADILRERRKCN